MYESLFKVISFLQGILKFPNFAKGDFKIITQNILKKSPYLFRHDCEKYQIFSSGVYNGMC